VGGRLSTKKQMAAEKFETTIYTRRYIDAKNANKIF